MSGRRRLGGRGATPGRESRNMRLIAMSMRLERRGAAGLGIAVVLIAKSGSGLRMRGAAGEERASTGGEVWVQRDLGATVELVSVHGFVFGYWRVLLECFRRSGLSVWTMHSVTNIMNPIALCSSSISCSLKMPHIILPSYQVKIIIDIELSS